MALRPVQLSRRPFIAVFAGLLATQMLAGPARAAPEPDAAAEVVRSLVAEVFRLIGQDTDEAAATNALIPVVERQADIELLGRLILGRHWRTASPEQRAEYDALFRDYMLETFVKRLRPYIGSEIGAFEQRFEIQKTQELNRRDVLVRSSLVPPGSPALQVDWRLREREGRLVIIDLVVEGVSLLVTHRSEFGAVLNRGGMDGLLDELRGRVTESI